MFAFCSIAFASSPWCRRHTLSSLRNGRLRLGAIGVWAGDFEAVINVYEPNADFELY
jgi:hypothetical protein